MMQISFHDESGKMHHNVDVISANLDGVRLTYQTPQGNMRRTHIAHEDVNNLHSILNNPYAYEKSLTATCTDNDTSKKHSLKLISLTRNAFLRMVRIR